MVLVQPENLDVVGLAEDDLEAAFQVFTVRGGRVLGRKGWVVDRVEDLDRPELVASFLRQLYMEREDVPPRILVPTEPADREVLETWLSDRRGSARHDRRAGTRREAAADGGRGPATRRRRSIGTSSGAPRTSARVPARSRSSPSSSASSRHRCGSSATTSPTSGPSDTVGSDGRLRGRPARSARTTAGSRSRASPGRTISPAWRRCSPVGSHGC